MQITSKAAEIRDLILKKCDDSSDLYCRLNSQADLLGVSAKYLKSCYIPYCRERNQNSQTDKEADPCKKLQQKFGMINGMICKTEKFFIFPNSKKLLSIL